MKFFCFATLLAVSISSSSFSQQFAFDSFDDDTNRLNWREFGFGAFSRAEVDNGSMTLESEGGAYYGVTSGGDYDYGYIDVSIETLIRATKIPDDWMFAGVLGRTVGGQSYYIGIGGHDTDQIRYGESSSVETQDEKGIDVPFDVRNSAVRLRLDIEGENIRGYAWEDGSTVPALPLFEFEDDTIASGNVGFWINTPGSRGAFSADWIKISPLPIGDFNDTGELDNNDLDYIAQGIRENDESLLYDFDSSGTANVEDLHYLVHSELNTYIGDANLDGEFNSADFVQVFAAAEYEDAIAGNSTWATGDWNGDGDFDSSDFVVAFQDGGYEQGARPAAVPESNQWCWAVVLCGLLLRTQRFGRVAR